MVVRRKEFEVYEFAGFQNYYNNSKRKKKFYESGV